MASETQSRAVRHIRNLAAIALGGVFLWLFGPFLMVLFIGVLLAVGLHAPSALLARHTPLSYGWSLAIVTVSLVALAVGVGWGAAPSIASQADEMRARIPELIELGRSRLEQYQWGQDLLESGSGGAGDIATSSQLWTGLAGVFSTAFGAAANLVLILFVGLYLAVEPGLYKRGVVFLAPDRMQPRLNALLEERASVLRHWLFGTLLSMLTIGVLTFIGLTVLGVPLALLLAVIAALLAFIPNIGPVIAAVPAVLLSLLDGPQQALYVALLYIGVQTVESYLVTPFIQRRTVSLPPALTISAQFLLGMLAGALGLFVATPLAAVGLTLAKRLRGGTQRDAATQHEDS
jgi:predicted PurR-regulated permease PerM